MEPVRWTRELTCGSGPTCPRAGRDPASGRVLVVGRIETDLALIDQAGVGPGEILISVPEEILPEVT